MRSEILYAIKIAKSDKALGSDEINIEAIKLLEEENTDVLVKLFNNIYDTGHIPSDWLQSTFIMLPKKINATKCKDHRLVSLMSHLLIIFLRILLQRWSGNTKGVNTLVQSCLDQRKDVLMAFIDYEKALDNVRHDTLYRIYTGIKRRESNWTI